MSTCNYCFKILLHDLIVEDLLFTPSVPAIARPALSVRLFNYPTFMIYAGTTINRKILSQNNWVVHVGKGKSVVLTMTEQEILNAAQDMPLTIHLIDAANERATILGKCMVDLSVFKNVFSERNPSTKLSYKTKEFKLHDELQRTIGSAKLSVFLGFGSPNEALTSNAFKTNHTNDSLSNFSQKKQQSSLYNQENVYEEQIPGPKPSPFGQANKSIAFEKQKGASKLSTKSSLKTDVIQDGKKGAAGPTLKASAINRPHTAVETAPTLKTLAEGNFCPPVMVFSKKKKAVELAEQQYTKTVRYEDETQPTQPLFYQASENRTRQKIRPATATMSRNNQPTQSTSVEANISEAVKTIVMLSNKESQAFVDKMLLEGIGQSGTALDILINELIKHRKTEEAKTPAFIEQKTPIRKERKESDIIQMPGQGAIQEAGWSMISEENKNETQDIAENDSRKISARGKKVEFKENIKDTSVALDESYYTQDFEELSVSQSKSGSFGLKDKLQPILKNVKSSNQLNSPESERIKIFENTTPIVALKRNASTVSETYTDDFEDMSVMYEDSEVNTSVRKGRSRRYSGSKIDDQSFSQAGSRRNRRNSMTSERPSEFYEEDFEVESFAD